MIPSFRRELRYITTERYLLSGSRYPTVTAKAANGIDKVVISQATASSPTVAIQLTSASDVSLNRTYFIAFTDHSANIAVELTAEKIAVIGDVP